MRVRLMCADADFDTAPPEQSVGDDLVKDLDLTTLWDAASDHDQVIRASIRAATLAGLAESGQVDYRGEAFADCLFHPDVVRTMYELASHALDQERQVYRASFFSRSSGALLNRSVAALQVFVDDLRRLRDLSGREASGFASLAFTQFFASVEAELDDAYFAEITEHIRRLQFREGLVASARLGLNNQGIDYVLRLPRPENYSHLLPRRPPVRRPHLSRIMPADDDGAHQDLAGLRDRVLALAADAVAEAAAHLLQFFTSLRAELAFYLGCLRIHALLTGAGLPMCRAVPQDCGTAILSAAGIYDPCLALRSPAPVQGVDLHADGTPLIVVTGANQGGKSTLLRSIGLAYLMMQAGMPIAAQSFTASTRHGVFTHFAREEDATMTAGKFDEELERMSHIVAALEPGDLLLCNESFASTNEREAADIAIDILLALDQAAIAVVFVTHLYDLAHRLHELNSPRTLFLRADRVDADHPIYRICPEAPQPTSYGRELYERTFGPIPVASDSTGQVTGESGRRVQVGARPVSPGVLD